MKTKLKRRRTTLQFINSTKNENKVKKENKSAILIISVLMIQCKECKGIYLNFLLILFKYVPQSLGKFLHYFIVPFHPCQLNLKLFIQFHVSRHSLGRFWGCVWDMLCFNIFELLRANACYWFLKGKQHQKLDISITIWSYIRKFKLLPSK